MQQSEIFKVDTEKMKWYEKVLWFILKVSMFIPLMLIKAQMKNNIRKKAYLKSKIRRFNPVITEGFWGKKITWVGREKPLTDKELEQWFKNN